MHPALSVTSAAPTALPPEPEVHSCWRIRSTSPGYSPRCLPDWTHGLAPGASVKTRLFFPELFRRAQHRHAVRVGHYLGREASHLQFGIQGFAQAALAFEEQRFAERHDGVAAHCIGR